MIWHSHKSEGSIGDVCVPSQEETHGVSAMRDGSGSAPGIRSGGRRADSGQLAGAGRAHRERGRRRRHVPRALGDGYGLRRGAVRVATPRGWRAVRAASRVQPRTERPAHRRVDGCPDRGEAPRRPGTGARDRARTDGPQLPAGGALFHPAVLRHRCGGGTERASYAHRDRPGGSRVGQSGVQAQLLLLRSGQRCRRARALPNADGAAAVPDVLGRELCAEHVSGGRRGDRHRRPGTGLDAGERTSRGNTARPWPDRHVRPAELPDTGVRPPG